jgi:signal transduction histidine kinase
MVLLVLLASLLVIVSIGALHVWVMQTKLREHELQRAEADVKHQVELYIEHGADAALLAGDPDAIAAFDARMYEDFVRTNTVGLALWRPDGTVVYALDKSYIGKVYPLPNGASAALATGVEQSQIGGSNAAEAAPGWRSDTAIEVFAPLRSSRTGIPLVWEVGLRREELSKQAERLVVSVALLLGLGAGILLLAQGLLSFALVKRNDREREYRHWLTQRVSEMAAVERRQIAADLHDGVVQELAGIALDLEAPLPGLESAIEKSERKAFASRVRDAVATLRGQTAELYPTAAALIDVPTALQSMLNRMPRGIEKQLDIDPDADIEPGYRWLVFRVAQEALRNVTQHSKAPQVNVALRRPEVGTVLTVTDNGRGFSPETDAVEPGHMGLSLMSDTATAAGAQLTIRSAKGEGTTIRLEVPE